MSRGNGSGIGVEAGDEVGTRGAAGGYRTRPSPSSHILGRAFQGPPFRHIEMVVRTQVFDQVVLARESIGTFAGAVLDRAVAKDRVVDAGLVALEVCKACESLAAVIATEGLSWSLQNRC